MDLIKRGDLKVPIVVAGNDRNVKRDIQKQKSQTLWKLPLIVADNVADYVYNTRTGDTINFREDFPCLAPPFEEFFIEWKVPAAKSGEKVVEFVGIHLREIVNPLMVELKKRPEDEEWRKQLEGTEFAVLVELYAKFECEKHVVGPITGWLLTLDREGVLNYPPHPVILGVKGLEIVDHQTLRDFLPYMNSLLVPGLYALTFMHCKNVQSEVAFQTDKLRKAYKKRHNKDLVTYRVLSIEPMKKILRTEGRGQDLGFRRAMHICRGHFKNYQLGKGLFGKYKGLFFWDQQVRGCKEEGMVQKDYNIVLKSKGPSGGKELMKVEE